MSAEPEAPPEGGTPKRRRDTRDWPYAVGVRGLSRVRVYNRDDSRCIQVEWFDDRGRQQRSLRTVVGEPVTDRTLARDIADRMSAEMEEKAHRKVEQSLWGHSTLTLGDLAKQYHESREPDWRETHIKGQRRYRDFWLEALGEETVITRVTPDAVKRAIREAAEERGWEEATKDRYRRWIVDLYGYARDDLRAITEEHDLRGRIQFSRKKQRGRGEAYSEAEARKLLPALWDVDPRAWVVGEAYYQAGRRLDATRQLHVEQVRVTRITVEDEAGDPTEIECVILAYPAETDKAKVASEAVLVGEDVVDRIREMLEMPAVNSTGLLCPMGPLEKRVPKKRARPIRKEYLIDMLTEAERQAEIEHVKGRAYHGLKRRMASMGRKEREIAALQAGTTEQVMRDVYEQDAELAEKAGFAYRMRKR